MNTTLHVRQDEPHHRWVWLFIGLLAACGFAPKPSWSQAPGTDTPATIELDATHIGPRAIEDLTNKSVSRDYGLAWSTMSRALAENRSDLLEGYFTGLAKDGLAKRVDEQAKAGIRTRYHDQGHSVEAIFYSPAGDAMQLRDRVRLKMEVLDGDKVIHSEEATWQYLVLMTPGADRWLVRDLQSIPDARKP